MQKAAYVLISPAFIHDFTVSIANGPGLCSLEQLSNPSVITAIGCPADTSTVPNFLSFYLHPLDRNSTCPAFAQVEEAVDWPCGQTGTCLFNRTLQSTMCNCPVGLSGEQCEHGELVPVLKF